MNEDNRLRGLERLSFLRERQVELLSVDMTSRRTAQRRYARNIERLEELCRSSGASSASGRAPAPALSATLSLNCAGYKQAVMKMTDAHRVDLSLHEADMELAQASLAAAVRRREALDHVLERARQGARHLRNRREQKRQDETAIQVWKRRRP
jgi:flagellar export protein FliJ